MNPKRSDSIRRQNLTISRLEKVMQWIGHEAAKAAGEDQTYATTHLEMKGKAFKGRRIFALN